MLKQYLAALIVALVGLACHVAGWTYVEADQAQIAHLSGGAFDVVAGALAFVAGKRRPPSSGSIATVLMLGVMGVGGGGCTTSEPFRAGAERLGNRVVQRVEPYVLADTAITDAERANRLADVAKLRDAVAVPAAITYEGVTAVWPAVRAIYLPYLDNDAVLATKPSILRLRRATPLTLDGLIHAEGLRRATLGILGDGRVERAANEGEGGSP